MIKTIATDGLRRMKDSEGLIIQGCGGDLHTISLPNITPK